MGPQVLWGGGGAGNNIDDNDNTVNNIDNNDKGIVAGAGKGGLRTVYCK